MIYSPTRAKIQAMVRYFLEDANVGRTWKNWQINVAINNALTYLQAQIIKLDKGWFERRASFGLTSGVAVYTLTSDISKIKLVEFVNSSGQGRPLVRAYPTQILKNIITSSTPTHYFFLGRRQIGIYPIPESTVPFVNTDSGPIRVTYLEKLPRFVELDHPIAFETNSAPAQVAADAYETFDIAHQAFGGPAVSFDLEEFAANDDYIPIRAVKLVALFVKRDATKSRYSPPEVIGMPWVSPYSLLVVPQTSSMKVHITKWPLGDPDDSQWPEDATHLDLWLYVSGNPAHPVLNPVSGSNYHDMCFLGNILPTDDYADGEIVYTALGGGQVSVNPGEEGAGIWDGRYAGTLEPDGTGEALAGFNDSSHTDRWIHQIPPTPYHFPYQWAPYDTDNIFVDLPNSGTGVYFDTNPAKGDADIISEDITDDSSEIIGVRAALNELVRHGLYNKILMAHFDDLFVNFKEVFASKDSAPRIVNITNPDMYQVSRNTPPNMQGKLRT